jgi:hypothetical protein
LRLAKLLEPAYMLDAVQAGDCKSRHLGKHVSPWVVMEQVLHRVVSGLGGQHLGMSTPPGGCYGQGANICMSEYRLTAINLG